jgi:hypothetical protein
MDKYELINITLQRLIDHFERSPESFEFKDSVVIWQPKVALSDQYSIPVNDPNNNHAVAIGFNSCINELKCYLFLKTTYGLSFPNPQLSNADSVMTSSRWFEKWRGNYRKYCKLVKLIQTRDKHKENMEYLRKLTSLFPDAVDDHIFK